LKSCTDCQAINFGALQARLLSLISLRLDNGEFTERGLARLIGVSQPHIHNVLKGKRKLQTELADRIMRRFNISILDLFQEAELRKCLAEHPSVPGQSGAELALRPRKPFGREIVRQSTAQDLAS